MKTTQAQIYRRGRQTRIGLLLLRVGGFTHKEAANLLGISQKNGEHHWERVIRKNGTRCLWRLAEMVRAVPQAKWALCVATLACLAVGCASTVQSPQSTVQSHPQTAIAEAVPAPSVTLIWTNPPDDFWHVETLPENYAVRALNWQTGVTASQDLCSWSEVWVSPYTNLVVVTIPVSGQQEFYRAFNRWAPRQ